MNRKDELFNDLKTSQVHFSSTTVASDGSYCVQVLTNVLWYDGSYRLQVLTNALWYDGSYCLQVLTNALWYDGYSLVRWFLLSASANKCSLVR